MKRLGILKAIVDPAVSGRRYDCRIPNNERTAHYPPRLKRPDFLLAHRRLPHQARLLPYAPVHVDRGLKVLDNHRRSISENSNSLARWTAHVDLSSLSLTVGVESPTQPGRRPRSWKETLVLRKTRQGGMFRLLGPPRHHATPPASMRRGS